MAQLKCPDELLMYVWKPLSGGGPYSQYGQVTPRSRPGSHGMYAGKYIMGCCGAAELSALGYSYTDYIDSGDIERAKQDYLVCLLRNALYCKTFYFIVTNNSSGQVKLLEEFGAKCVDKHANALHHPNTLMQYVWQPSTCDLSKWASVFDHPMHRNNWQSGRCLNPKWWDELSIEEQKAHLATYPEETVQQAAAREYAEYQKEQAVQRERERQTFMRNIYYRPEWLAEAGLRKLTPEQIQMLDSKSQTQWADALSTKVSTSALDDLRKNLRMKV